MLRRNMPSRNPGIKHQPKAGGFIAICTQTGKNYTGNLGVVVMRRLFLSAILLSFVASTAFAGQCRDTSGKFIKCPPAKAQVMKCKDAKGKFAKCGTPGAKPI